jgi:hypothetical protein
MILSALSTSRDLGPMCHNTCMIIQFIGLVEFVHFSVFYTSALLANH